MIHDGYDRAKEIIEEHREALVRIAEALLEREVLDGDEVKLLIEGETLPPFKAAADKTQPVIRPEGGLRVPGLMEGEGPQPA